MLLAQTASLPQPVPPHKGKEAEGRRKRHSERLELPQASVSPTAGPCGRRPGHGGEVVQIGGGGSPEQERARLKKTLAMIDFKCWYYSQAVATGSEDFTAAIPEGLPEEVRKLYDASHT